MADIGIPELLIILAIIIVLFGPGKIAGLGHSIGTSIREFRSAVKGETEVESSELKVES